MSRSTFTLFVGVFSVALYLFMTIFVILYAGLYNMGAEVIAADEKISEETQYAIAEVTHAVNGYTLILLGGFVFMFIASILMVYGVKKERYQYIAPWVVLNAICVVLELVVLFFRVRGSETDSEHSTFAYIVTTVISAAIWYPVFKYYESLKDLHHVAACGYPCSGAGYVAPNQVCAAPSEYSHVNAKYVPACKV